jgi:hypothetical protein
MIEQHTELPKRLMVGHKRGRSSRFRSRLDYDFGTHNHLPCGKPTPTLP